MPIMPDEEIPFRTPSCINGYNTTCPDCGEPIERYYGQPKIMRCASCAGKHAAEESIAKLRKTVKEI
jgi:hypothetical protein